MTTRPTHPDGPVRGDERGHRRERHVRRDARFLPMLAGPAGAAVIRRTLSILVLLVIDLTATFCGIYAVLALKLLVQGDPVDSSAIWAVEQKALPIAAGTLVLLFWKNGLYGPRDQRGGAARILSSVTFGTFIVLLVVLMSGWRLDTYYIFYGSWVMVSAAIITLRASYESVTAYLLEKLSFERRALLVGQPALMDTIAAGLEDSRNGQRIPYRVVGRHLLVSGISSDAVAGAPAALRAALDPADVDEVILAGWSGADGPVLELLDVCRRRGLPVRLAPTTTELLSHSVEAVPAPGVPLFELRPPVLGGGAFLLKRAFDVVVAAILGILVLPVLAIAALAIKLDDGGSIIHRSRRVGVDEREFDCMKLRTMSEDAEERQAEIEDLNEADGALFKMTGDPRITRVGGLLRRLSIDELPQLWNVIRGQMSLVGPRPLPLRDYNLLDDVQKQRYLVLPGITGLWQVSGRSDLSFDDLVRLDFYYIEKWSIWLDLTIIARTIPVVFSRRGAY